MISKSLQKFKGLSVVFPSNKLSLNFVGVAPQVITFVCKLRLVPVYYILFTFYLQLQLRTSSTESYTEKQAKKVYINHISLNNILGTSIELVFFFVGSTSITSCYNLSIPRCSYNFNHKQSYWSIAYCW